MDMKGVDLAARCRVGELASSPLDIAVAAQIRVVIATARRTTSTKSGGTTRSRSRRTTRKETAT